VDVEAAAVVPIVMDHVGPDAQEIVELDALVVISSDNDWRKII